VSALAEDRSGTAESPPYAAYAAIMGTFAGGLACAGGLARLLTWSLAAAGINDYLQAGFAALTSKANELEQRAGDWAGNSANRTTRSV
jgi:hypothetical protein